ncbi:MAG: hypothetical protein VKK97_10175 [Synechococcaceae cyanobacterium]|nr:hypothetical protein [Synechococcaceae cyanobacterium]
MKARLTEEQVIEILTSPASHRTLGDRFGLHRSAISLIRLGKLHAKVAMHIPRWGTEHRCEHCIHWQPERFEPCDLGHRDPIDEGTHFARECATFERAA